MRRIFRQVITCTSYREQVYDLLPITDFNFSLAGSTDQTRSWSSQYRSSSQRVSVFIYVIAVPVELVEYRVELDGDLDTKTQL